MISRSRKPIAGALALVTLAVFGFALVEASLVHTDDGCAVELHCFACRWALASTAIVRRPAPLPTNEEPAGRTVSFEPSRTAPALGREQHSRGPPHR